MRAKYRLGRRFDMPGLWVLTLEIWRGERLLETRPLMWHQSYDRLRQTAIRDEPTIRWMAGDFMTAWGC